MYDATKHKWGYFLKDDFRHLVIETNRRLWVGIERDEEVISFLKTEFVKFMNRFEKGYEISGYFEITPINIYKGD